MQFPLPRRNYFYSSCSSCFPSRGWGFVFSPILGNYSHDLFHSICYFLRSCLQWLLSAICWAVSFYCSCFLFLYSQPFYDSLLESELLPQSSLPVQQFSFQLNLTGRFTHPLNYVYFHNCIFLSRISDWFFFKVYLLFFRALSLCFMFLFWGDSSFKLYW